MFTEITNTTDAGEAIILYDDHCPICAGGARRFEPMLSRRNIRLVPLHSPRACQLSGARIDQLMTEVHLVTPSRTVLRGADALLYVARTMPWARALCVAARLPGVLPLLRAAYRAFARHRYRISAACATLARWLAPVMLVATALALRSHVPDWGFMWILAGAMFFAAKWITWFPYRRRGSPSRGLLYLLAWTGMDANTFLDARITAARPVLREWIEPAVKAAAGLALLCMLPPDQPLIAAAAGFLGLILLLHFGLFHLLALLYRYAGIAATPLMNRPLRSRSLGEFWGRRWNSGFNALVEQTIFAPMRRPFGAAQATMTVFLVSGVIHDLIISLPARGGYGLPTLYFLIQLLGLLIERTRPMRRITRTWLGWLYTAAFTLLSLPLLFHEPFLRNVMLPFLHAIGALS